MTRHALGAISEVGKERTVGNKRSLNMVHAAEDKPKRDNVKKQKSSKVEKPKSTTKSKKK